MRINPISAIQLEAFFFRRVFYPLSDQQLRIDSNFFNDDKDYNNWILDNEWGNKMLPTQHNTYIDKLKCLFHAKIQYTL